MTEEEIRSLAEKESKFTKAALENRIAELKSLKCSILECIVYVRVNQNCSLSDAKELVVNSSAWSEKKEEFIKHQKEQMEEFLIAAKDDVKEIKQTFYPDKTEISITFNTEK